MMMYKIIIDDVYPQCCASNLTADEAKAKVKDLRAERPGMEFHVFTMDGDSVYW